MRKLSNPRRALVLVVASAICLFGLAALVSSSAAVTVSVAPPLTTVTQGDPFTVDLTTDAVSDLKGYNIIVSFDPSIVQLTGITAGTVLTGSGFPYQDYVVPDYTAPTDSAWYNAAVLTGSTQGPGTLAVLHFAALAAGYTNVVWQKADFRNSQNVRTLPNQVGGVIHVIGIVPTKATTWGALRRLYGAGTTSKVLVIPGVRR